MYVLYHQLHALMNPHPKKTIGHVTSYNIINYVNEARLNRGVFPIIPVLTIFLEDNTNILRFL